MKPVIDSHSAWESVWCNSHKSSQEHTVRAILVYTGFGLVLISIWYILRLRTINIVNEIFLTSLYAGLIIYHFGCKIIPYFANGLHNAAKPLESGFYDPKALPSLNTMFGYIWIPCLIGGVIVIKLVFPWMWFYQIIKQRQSIFLWALIHIYTADALLETLTPDFWGWFMD
jgi:hypothetical protein